MAERTGSKFSIEKADCGHAVDLGYRTNRQDEFYVCIRVWHNDSTETVVKKLRYLADQIERNPDEARNG